MSAGVCFGVGSIAEALFSSMMPLRSQPKRAALVFIFVTVVLDMLALGIIVPVLPKLVVAFLDGDIPQGARIYGTFATVWALMHFAFAPLLGALSDRFGRRPVILLSNFGLGLDYVLMALAPTLGFLFVGRVISGITSASFNTAGAYIADVTPPERRAGAFGSLGAAFGLGFVLGPAIGGLLGSIDPRLPFWVAALLSLLNACYGLVVLPESLPIERRSGFTLRKANPLGSLRLLRSHPDLFGLATVSFFANLAHEVLPSTFVLYGSYRYGWDERTLGLTLAVVGVCSALVQGVLVRPIVERIGERRALLVGLGFGASGFATFAFAGTGSAFWLGIPLMSLWGMSGPSAQGLMTRRVKGTEQGQLQGAHGSLRGIARLIGPLVFTTVFARFIEADAAVHLPGAPFLLAAVLLCASFGLAVRTAPAA